MRAQIAAWVLFCSLSFRRMAFICTFTVDSVITSLRAMILFDAPSVSVRKITSSRRDRLLRDVVARHLLLARRGAELRRPHIGEPGREQLYVSRAVIVG